MSSLPSSKHLGSPSLMIQALRLTINAAFLLFSSGVSSTTVALVSPPWSGCSFMCFLILFKTFWRFWSSALFDTNPVSVDSPKDASCPNAENTPLSFSFFCSTGFLSGCLGSLPHLRSSILCLLNLASFLVLIFKSLAFSVACWSRRSRSFWLISSCFRVVSFSTNSQDGIKRVSRKSYTWRLLHSLNPKPKPPFTKISLHSPYVS